MAWGNDGIAARAAREAYGDIPNSCQASPGLDPASAHFHELETRFNELSVVRKKNHVTRFPGEGKGLTFLQLYNWGHCVSNRGVVV